MDEVEGGVRGRNVHRLNLCTISVAIHPAFSCFPSADLWIELDDEPRNNRPLNTCGIEAL